VRILVKIGGAQLEQAPARAAFVRSVRAAREAGHELFVVHGGGNQIRELCARLGIREEYRDGLRVTDAATAEVVVMVLAGLVNKGLVHALRAGGVPAAGICGVDGGLFDARPIERLGLVGAVEKVDPRVALALAHEGFVPVIASVASGPAAATGEALYNVNADMAAGPLAAALECDALLFLTDVPGVHDAERRRIAGLSRARCVELRAAGVIQGGMIPKVESALAGAEACARALVKIAPAEGEEAVLRALTPDVGTRFTKEEPWTSTS
jgi:acetylglutamate kinase